MKNNNKILKKELDTIQREFDSEVNFERSHDDKTFNIPIINSKENFCPLIENDKHKTMTSTLAKSIKKKFKFLSGSLTNYNSTYSSENNFYSTTSYSVTENNSFGKEKKNLDSLYEEVILFKTILKSIFNKDLVNLKKTLDEREDLLEKIVNHVDLRGNTPLILCVILRSLDNSSEYLKLMNELFKYKANPKIRNLDNLAPLDLAISFQDYDAICLIYDNLLKRRSIKISRNLEKASIFLSKIPNFYFEMNWEVNVPLLGFLCPKDTCKIWKYSQNVRMDYTFSEFKNLSSIRKPSSFILKEKTSNSERAVFKIDYQSNTYFNPFEPLEDDEKELIVKDIMNCHRLNTEFKIRNCIVNQSKTFWNGKNVYEMVDGIKCQKYEVNITAFVNLLDQQKLEYENLNITNYLDATKTLDKKTTILMDEIKLKNHIANGLKVKNDKIRNQIMKISNNKDKKLKAYLWIAENYPIKSSDLVALFDSLAGATEYTQKIKEFLNEVEVKNIIEKNGFPIKICIPFNFLIDVTVTFTKFIELKDNKIMEKYIISEKCNNIPRKAAQNLAVDNKRRLGYANIQG